MKHLKRIETSKLLAIYLFGLLNAIVVFAMVAMWHFSDLSYLGVLITDVAAQVVVYAIYCLKAYNSKKQSERLKFDRERLGGGAGFEGFPGAGVDDDGGGDTGTDGADIGGVGSDE